MKSKKNAFTLIELLAIIVILAIIAVITVPIILNIIENSRMGAATDSAYGYKDAVNKWYVTKLSEDSQFQLASSYTISSDGKLGDIVIPISGDKPSGGYLNYSNNSLTGGCLVFGDYAVTFEGGNATKTEKGKCIPTIASCPNCKFIFTTDSLSIGGNMPEGTTDSYTNWTEENNSHTYFLGLIESPSDSTKIGRAFACGIGNGTPFCLEGTIDGSKFSDNVGILKTIFQECIIDDSDSYPGCNWLGGNASTQDIGDAIVYGANDSACWVGSNGNVGCDEE